MNQRKYALEMISEVGLAAAKPVMTPLECNMKLNCVEFDEGSAINDDLFPDINKYQRLKPKRSHWEAALRVIRYIKVEPRKGLLMSANTKPQLTGFCDADWAVCPNTRRSVTGFVLKFGDSLISWKSKKQNTVSRSSDEAEYRSLATLTAEIIWVDKETANALNVVESNIGDYSIPSTPIDNSKSLKIL
uniref:Reverse transcriptase Ty1/copia-type domain-containing protein n=1 Tax=Solanum lycopersicum TaxID=4081 RepID=A0A3Q7IC70_SOLLC